MNRGRDGRPLMAGELAQPEQINPPKYTESSEIPRSGLEILTKADKLGYIRGDILLQRAIGKGALNGEDDPQAFQKLQAYLKIHPNALDKKLVYCVPDKSGVSCISWSDGQWVPYRGPIDDIFDVDDRLVPARELAL